MINIEKVEIANFRSFKEKKYSNDLNSLGKINVFTGENNTGKTNTLRAINLFFNPASYNPDTDIHFIKIKTGGGAKNPIITLKFNDDEMVKNTTLTYSLTYNFNNSEYSYKILKQESELHQDAIEKKFASSKKIKDYLDLKFKCVYISATDEIIIDQTDRAIKDMILQYYKQQNDTVKESISKFEKNYQDLRNTLQTNIKEIEKSMEVVFEPSKSGLNNIHPEFNIIENLDINSFLLQNLSFKIDDSYSHNIDNKGAGVQRSTLILLNIFLLEEIYHRKNKIILLDEPEAFLYPLLIERIKDNLENAVNTSKNKFQIFLTTHSATFLSEVNNPCYSYYNMIQKSEERRFERSLNETDTVKYSIVNKYDTPIKNQVLKNYGLLHNIENYEYVVLCEGQTDANYIRKLYENAKITPQIRYGSYFKDMKFVGRGAHSIMSLMFYLENINSIDRKVFILLDGDKEGKDVAAKIKKEKFENLSYELEILPNGKQIEDIVFDTASYADKLIALYPETFKKITKNELINFLKVDEPDTKEKSVIERTEVFLSAYKSSLNISKIKHSLSKDLSNIQGQELYHKINEYFEFEQ